MNKGLIAKCQDVRGQIEDRHFSRVNDAVLKSTVHSPLPPKQRKIVRENCQKWHRPDPIPSLISPNPSQNHRPGCLPQIARVFQFSSSLRCASGARIKLITNSPTMAGLLVFSFHPNTEQK